MVNGLNRRPHRADGLGGVAESAGRTRGVHLAVIREKLGATIEACALDPGLWPEVLSGLADACGADGAALVCQSIADGTGSSVIVGIDPAATPLYFGELAAKNPLQVADTLQGRMEACHNDIHHDEHLLPKAEFERTDWYQGIFRPFDMHSVLMVGIGLRGVNRAGINFVRNRRRPQFEEDTIRAVERWHGSLTHAFEVGMALSPLESTRGDLAAALDTLSDAVFLVEAGARVVHANQAAQRFLANNQGVMVVAGRLRARHPEKIGRLDAVIAQAIEAGADGVMALERSSPGAPLWVTVTPLQQRRRWLFDGQSSAMVRIGNLDDATPVSADRLIAAFDLTVAEARVAAAVGAGESPRAVAERLGVSFNTVRAQLARVFEKVGVSRQVELARLLSRLTN
jgi:DNA-binding CsgD family transcriptional regulator/PAS domain-containing protein